MDSELSGAMIPPRLPPPPFWRTHHFEQNRALEDRAQIRDEEVLAVLAAPLRSERQTNGRLRHWGWVPRLQRWLRVVTLDDGETVHTVFLDRRFTP
ncbi:hypothetical protein [Azospirillum sp.]|uniref:hypothetical protein n=1 Tax=Azospirillum sp. TaxID=34012 RepID=UPI002D369EE8|nr:hypothetical protein [Azospirillum sp.]HYD69766.1 hypothetical protein [Azospirillum sp.]